MPAVQRARYRDLATSAAATPSVLWHMSDRTTWNLSRVLPAPAAAFACLRSAAVSCMASICSACTRPSQYFRGRLTSCRADVFPGVLGDHPLVYTLAATYHCSSALLCRCCRCARFVQQRRAPAPWPVLHDWSRSLTCRSTPTTQPFFCGGPMAWQATCSHAPGEQPRSSTCAPAQASSC